jgi:hypothetical protein
MVLKFGHFGKLVKNTLTVLKCGAGEGWRRSIGPIIREMKKCCKESRRRVISYKQQNEGRLTGLITSCVRTAF